MTTNANNGLLLAHNQWQNSKLLHPLKILLLNLMPNKATTEHQFLKSFNDLNQDVSFTFTYPESHVFKGIARQQIETSYISFTAAAKNDYDALIITGAPVETLNFNQVDYWTEFKQIIQWSHTHVRETLFECWAAQAALALEFNAKKVDLAQKVFGVYSATHVNHEYINGLSAGGLLKMPQSRHTRIDPPNEVTTIASNDAIGAIILQSSNLHQTYLTGHPEYDTDTLKKEYERDLKKNLSISAPKNYFNQHHQIQNTWKNSSHLIYQNWLNLIRKG